jgi:hypothetical protein
VKRSSTSNRRLVPRALLLVSLLAVIWVWFFAGDEPMPTPLPPIQQSEGPANQSAEPVRVVPEPPAAAPGPAPQPPPDEIPSIGEFTIAVRDLADGSPVPGVSFRLCVHHTESGEEVISATADAEGFLSIPGDGVQTIRCVTQGWFTPFYKEGALKKEREVWLYRIMPVRVTVRASEGTRKFDPETVRLDVLHQGIEVSPWTRFWFDQHDLGIARLSNGPGPHGVVTIKVPRMRGQVIRASSPGWQPAGESIPVPEAEGGISVVDLELKAASIPIRGRLTGSDGEPMVDALVTAYVIIETTIDQIDREKVRLAGHAWGLGYSSLTGRAVLTYQISARTRGNGEFDIGANVKGEVVLVVYPPGEHKPVFERLGSLSDEGLTADLHAEAGNRGEKVQFAIGGSPLRGAMVTISDVALSPPQPAFSAKLDSEGRMPTSWLTPGHRYTLTTRPRTKALEFEWREQKVLDINVLWEELGDYLKRREQAGK